MRGWSPEKLAEAAGATLIASPPATTTGPERTTIDSRQVRPGTLFVGLSGTQTDGGLYAAQALRSGAWGTLTTPEHAYAIEDSTAGVVLAAGDPLKALQTLATAWRRRLDARVIGVTGSTGKTSTKDLIHALLAPERRTVASRANFNTEIGLPLEILDAPAETEVLVLEMGMRGAGQIAELAQIAEPDIAVIVSIGPVHLELLGSIEAIAAAKAELIAALPRNGTAIVPADEPLLEPHLRDDVKTVAFGEGGDVSLTKVEFEEEGPHAYRSRLEIDLEGTRVTLDVPFTQAHLQRNLLAAVAAANAVGVTPTGRLEVEFSPGRGQRKQLPDGVTLIDDCYNANPMSMRAALDDLAVTTARNPGSRRVAVLGDMLELGPDELRFHAEVGRHASDTDVDVLVTVGPLAAAMSEGFDGEQHAVANATEAAALLPELLHPDDVILVKGSRGVGLELVCRALEPEAVS